MQMSGAELAELLTEAKVSQFQLSQWTGGSKTLPWHWCHSKKLQGVTTKRIIKALLERCNQLEYQLRQQGGTFKSGQPRIWKVRMAPPCLHTTKPTASECL